MARALPNELQLHILSFLSTEDLWRAALARALAAGAVRAALAARADVFAPLKRVCGSADVASWLEGLARPDVIAAAAADWRFVVWAREPPAAAALARCNSAAILRALDSCRALSQAGAEAAWAEAARAGAVGALEWLLRERMPLTAEAAARAAVAAACSRRKGVLAWLRARRVRAHHLAAGADAVWYAAGAKADLPFAAERLGAVPALYWTEAVRRRRWDWLEWLFAHARKGRDSARALADAFACAVKCSDYDALRALRSRAPWPADLCALAAGCGLVRVLEWLTARGAPIDPAACARIAVRMGDLPMLQWLRARYRTGAAGADPRCRNAAAQWLACQAGPAPDGIE